MIIFVILLLLIVGVATYIYFNPPSPPGTTENELLRKKHEEIERIQIDEERVHREAEEARQKAQIQVMNYNGEYSGVRGYTDSKRRSPANECKARYSFDAIIENGRISFISDGRNFKGSVDGKGNLYIDNSGIRPSTQTSFRVTGPLDDARMTSGYCGNGYFYLQRK